MKIDYKQINLAVALLLDGKPAAAVTTWNDAGLTPQLARAGYDAQREMLRLMTKDGQVAEISLDDMLAQLQMQQPASVLAG